MSRKVTTSLKIPDWLQAKLLATVIADGYGMRGKTQWVVESIQSFLSIPEYWDMVSIADEIQQHDAVLTFRLQESLAQRLEQSVKTVREQYPLLEGVKSRIVRSSILQRFIRSGVFLED